MSGLDCGGVWGGDWGVGGGWWVWGFVGFVCGGGVCGVAFDVSCVFVVFWVGVFWWGGFFVVLFVVWVFGWVWGLLLVVVCLGFGGFVLGWCWGVLVLCVFLCCVGGWLCGVGWFWLFGCGCCCLCFVLGFVGGVVVGGWGGGVGVCWCCGCVGWCWFGVGVFLCGVFVGCFGGVGGDGVFYINNKGDCAEKIIII